MKPIIKQIFKIVKQNKKNKSILLIMYLFFMLDNIVMYVNM